MKRLLSIACGLSLVSCVAAADVSKDWPQWRGPDGSGASEVSNPPTTWSETENIKWKIEVPGIGSSTPIILGDRIYVSTAVKTDRVIEAKPETEEPQTEPRREAQPPRRERAQGGERGQGEFGAGRPGGRRGGGRGGFGGGSKPTSFYDFMVLAYDRNSGNEIWRTTVTQKVPHEAGHSTNTFASSSPVTDGERLYISFGSRGVFCLDLDGAQLWDVDLGTMQTRAQFGEGSSPAVHNGTLVVPWDHEGDSFIVALDAKTGEEKWRNARDEQTTWSTPFITDTDVPTWIEEDAAPYVSSPVLYKGQLYFVKANNGVLVSRDAKSGELLIDQTRLPDVSTVYASPVAAGDHIFLTGRDGTTLVLRHGKSFDVVAKNTLNDEIDASAAIVDDEIFLRSKTRLYCISH